MFLMALLALAGGGWLLDSAVQNRNPLTSLLEIIQDPANARKLAAETSGGTFVVDRGTSAGTVVNSVTTNSGPGVGSANAAESGISSAAALQALAWAQQQIGKPYKWGATGPNSFDCSGLVQAAYRNAGVSLPRTTGQMLLLKGVVASKAALKVGDLVFPDLGHVQIYAGNGQVVEAPHAGTNVRQGSMWGFLTARRVA